MPSRFQVALASALLCGVGESALAQTPGALRNAYRDHFDVGVALASDQLLTPKQPTLDLVAAQFSAVTPENAMKWGDLHPEPDRYDFAAADALVRFAEANKLQVTGHTLVWHSRTPDWVFQGEAGRPATREVVVARLRGHIDTVVGRYRGRVHGWDVVNEAILDDGAWRDSPWRRALGDDYLELAFRFAHDADPDARLYYNDYSMTNPGKRRATMALIERLRAAGVPIHGVGLQGHWRLDYPSEREIDAALADYARLGVDVMITELDIDVLPRPGKSEGADVTRLAARRPELDPYRNGLPADVQQKLAERYAAVFRLFLEHEEALTRVTLWGVDDGQTWHNNWPIPGRTAHSLLFDRELRPKPAYRAVLEAARGR